MTHKHIGDPHQSLRKPTCRHELAREHNEGNRQKTKTVCACNQCLGQEHRLDACAQDHGDDTKRNGKGEGHAEHDQNGKP